VPACPRRARCRSVRSARQSGRVIEFAGLGELGLHDRPSTPLHSPDATPAWVIARIETWRREKKWSANRITHELAELDFRINRRTVTRHLTRLGLGQRRAVVADWALEERRWSTPELLGVEQRLVAAATGRTDEQVAVVSYAAVRAALAAHPTAGEDQQAMVRDACQGSAGVALVIGRAGTGKTFALGAARHAWQLDGYRPLATAPTGIATISLEAEGFEEVATCDRLLADLDRGREQLNSRSCWCG
jgi:AAA domain